MLRIILIVAWDLSGYWSDGYRVSGVADIESDMRRRLVNGNVTHIHFTCTCTVCDVTSTWFSQPHNNVGQHCDNLVDMYMYLYTCAMYIMHIGLSNVKITTRSNRDGELSCQVQEGMVVRI